VWHVDNPSGHTWIAVDSTVTAVRVVMRSQQTGGGGGALLCRILPSTPLLHTICTWYEYERRRRERTDQVTAGTKIMLYAALEISLIYLFIIGEFNMSRGVAVCSFLLIVVRHMKMKYVYSWQSTFDGLYLLKRHIVQKPLLSSLCKNMVQYNWRKICILYQFLFITTGHWTHLIS